MSLAEYIKALVALKIIPACQTTQCFRVKLVTA